MGSFSVEYYNNNKIEIRFDYGIFKDRKMTNNGDKFEYLYLPAIKQLEKNANLKKGSLFINDAFHACLEFV